MDVIHEDLQVSVERTIDGYYASLGIVRAEISNLRYNRNQEIEADIRVYSVIGRIFWGRINLHSASKRQEIAFAYRKRGGDRRYPIEVALEVLFEYIVLDSLSRCEVWDYTPHSAVPIGYLIRPVIPSSGITVLAGDGGSGKGYFACAIALAVAAGRYANLQAAESGAVVYVDYESDANDFGTRIDRLVAGAGLDPDLLMPIRYVRLDTPYTAVRRDVERIVHEVQPRLVVLDSFAPAVEAGAEKSEAAITLMRALRALQCSVLMIAHISKAERASEERSPYGSVFLSNLARNVWMQRVVSRAPNRLTISLQHLKTNLDTLQPMRYYDLIFRANAVEVAPVLDSSRPDLYASLPLSQRIERALIRPMTVQEIATQLAEPASHIYNALAQMQASGWVRRIGSGRRNDPYRYILVDTRYTPVRPNATSDTAAEGISDVPQDNTKEGEIHE